MSIPLDRLYHYIEGIAEKTCGDVIIYRFFPHGSKNINDLGPLNHLSSWFNTSISVSIYCNDQEPLNYDLYQDKNLLMQSNKWSKLSDLVDRLSTQTRYNNFRYPLDIHDNAIILHSEKRSKNLEKYQQDHFVPVYYWCHALLARDWFRYAQYVVSNKKIKKLFLIYNRAWTGTREYRLKFLDLLIESNLMNHCLTAITTVDQESQTHYQDHVFGNSIWKPKNTLEDYISINSTDSTASADFDMNDYDSTGIEIVLETLFDDTRLHLTEKTLRPIACAQPFILAGTHGSLEYIKSYGFKTFDNLWSEQYDRELDPYARLIAIKNVMKEIASWNDKTREHKLSQAQAIANYNKELFFSEKFLNQVLAELEINLTDAVKSVVENNTGIQWVQCWKTLVDHPEIINFLNQFNNNPNYPSVDKIKQTLAKIQQIRPQTHL
jgi:hypothetical protein